MATVVAQSNTFTIPQFKLEWLQTEVARLAKRAARLGVSPPTVTVTGKPVVGKNSVGEDIVWIDVEITGQAPTLPGWSLAAVINVIEGQGIIKTMPGSLLPESFHKADPQWCDHCRTRRVRNDTFVLQHDDGTTFKQVGRQCLNDFVPGGHVSPEALAWFAAAMDAALSAASQARESDRLGGVGGGHHYINLQHYLSQVAKEIRTTGWVSRKTAYERGDVIATADSAMGKMNRGEPVEAEDRELAAQSIAWAASLSDSQTESSEFLHNIRTLADLGVVDHRTFRMAAATVNSFLSEKNRLGGLKPVTERTFIGTVGGKETLQATVIGEPVVCNGAYGTSYLYRFSVEGNLVCWYATNKQTALTPGATAKLLATIKKHDTYRPRNGDPTPQTVITRAKVL